MTMFYQMRITSKNDCAKIMLRQNKETMSGLKGVYVLMIRVDRDIRVSAGALGEVGFSKGLYAYVGSAQNNLEKRVIRHLRKRKPIFWHIDHLLDNKAANVVKVFHKKAEKIEECNIAKRFCNDGEPIEGFGSSDCNCRSHLFRIRDLKFLARTMQPLDLPSPGKTTN